MKLTATFLLFTVLQVWATQSYSQSTLLSIDFENASVAEVLKDIENQSEFFFLYSPKMIDVERQVSMKIKNNSINSILDRLFMDTNVRYVIKDRQIVITTEERLNILEPQQQLRTISGSVITERGEPLIGVTVVVKGTTRGTITDAMGRFTISDIPEDVILVVSFIGMKTQEIPVAGRFDFALVMVEETIGMDEVVVVGYGTQKKMNLTGSVASVSGEALENRPLPNVGEVLRGLSPNLNISFDGYGGEPGSSRRFNIRGMGSISGNDAPLILVDGIEMNINNLDPGNIESVSVLKDASASAIYGARAPFGVILITTKKGAKDSKMSVRYNNNYAFGNLFNVAHQEDALVFAMANNQAAANAGSSPVFSDSHIERIIGFMEGTNPYEYDPENVPLDIWQGRRIGNANYDWPHELLKPWKMDKRHNINLSGGSENSQFYISFGLFDEDGFYSIGYDDYKRYDVMANFTTRATNWLSFDLSTKYANTISDYPHGITTTERRYFFTNFYVFGPNTPKYNINGSNAHPMLASISNDAGRIRTTENDFVVTIATELEPVKGWKTRLSYNYNHTGHYNASTPKPVMVELGNGSFGNVGKPISAYEGTFSSSPYNLVNIVSSYENSLGNHNFKVLTGYEQEEKVYLQQFARADNLITEAVPSLSTALGNITVNDRMWDWSTQGIFGRLNYNFNEKYLFEFSARYNGSSRFAPESRWGFFPSASAGWQVSKENFWQPLEPYINRFKLRGSYGSLGNQNVANYMYIPSVSVVSQMPWVLDGQRPPYARTPGLIRDDLTWETITTVNFGIDAGFFNNRLDLVFDLFERITTNMLGPAETMPYTLATSAPFANNAEMSTKGFELILNWRDRISSDFSYNIQFILGDHKSKVLEYSNERGLINTWYAGKEVGEIWGFVTDKIIQNAEDLAEMPNQSAIHARWAPGDIMYKDLNDDSRITKGSQTLDDHGDLSRIGNSTPRYNFGISGGLNWKGFDFNMNWLGVGKRDYSPVRNLATFWGLNQSFAASAVLKDTPALDYWRPENETNMFGPNTNAYFARPIYSTETWKNREVQTRFLLNAAYARLKSAQLGYTLPQRVSNIIFMERARIYIAGENLLTIHGMPKAIDPEQTIAQAGQFIAYGGYYPIPRSISLGVNLTF